MVGYLVPLLCHDFPLPQFILGFEVRQLLLQLLSAVLFELFWVPLFELSGVPAFLRVLIAGVELVT